ncbi:MAG: hypothetical protein KGK18_09075, partial [Burkholderiales bacterium]|nr:hypothetical protein [Burkholderiales bacterium]
MKHLIVSDQPTVARLADRLMRNGLRLRKACCRFTAVDSKAAARAWVGGARARAGRLARFAGAAFAALRLPSG